MKHERCNAVVVDTDKQEHQCHQQEGHDGEHICGQYYSDGRGGQDMCTFAWNRQPERAVVPIAWS